MSSRERELLLNHTFADPDYAEQLRAIPGKMGYVGGYTLDDLEDMLGYIAAEANHCEDHKLQKELYGFLTDSVRYSSRTMTVTGRTARSKKTLQPTGFADDGVARRHAHPGVP